MKSGLVLAVSVQGLCFRLSPAFITRTGSTKVERAGMKYKPTKTPITKALIESKEYGWALVSGVAELFLVADTAKRGEEYWSCVL